MTDPLGRTITLHARTWYGHIIKGHPEMRGLRDLAEATISNPEEIRFSHSDDDCRLYFGPGPRQAVKIMVVADVVHGFVKTAHLVRQPTGGDIEWPS